MNIAPSSKVEIFLVQFFLILYLIMAVNIVNMSILIVDDDDFTRTIHQISLREYGFQDMNIKTAENGEQAVEMCRSGGHFDVITMDFSMPIMNGVEATKKLREMGVTSRIIAMSAEDNADLKERFREAGADKFIAKPLNHQKIASFFQNM